MFYPQLNRIQKHQSQILAMRGINLSDNYASGQMESCKNISSERYPYITTSEKVEAASTGIATGYYPVDMFAWNGLFVVSNEPSTTANMYKCFYNGRYCGDLPYHYGHRQYAVVNSKLVVFPDKYYFNLAMNETKAYAMNTALPLLRIAPNETVSFFNENGKGCITFLAKGVDYYLTAGSVLFLDGTPGAFNDGMYTLESFSTTSGIDTLKFTTEFSDKRQNYKVGSDEEIYIYKKGVTNYSLGEDGSGGNYVPDLDYICSLDNRLWGCSNKTKTIYVSALGDPSDLWTFEGTALDAYQVAVSSEGNFTGICALNNQVVFMKQHCIHKMLGSYPAEYTLYTYNFEGASESNGLSVVNVNGTAMYVSEHGIGNYTGSSAGVISTDICSDVMKDAVAMFDGIRYYLSFTDENNKFRTYSYDSRYGIWLQHDFGEVLCFAHHGDSAYYMVNNDYRRKNVIYKINTGTALDGEWEIVFKPFIEAKTGSYNSTSHIFETKRYTHLTLRVELPKGSWLSAEIKPDDLPYRKCARIEGRENNVQDFVIYTPRCAQLQLKLKGKGPMTLLAMERRYTLGSRR